MVPEGASVEFKGGFRGEGGWYLETSGVFQGVSQGGSRVSLRGFKRAQRHFRRFKGSQEVSEAFQGFSVHSEGLRGSRDFRWYRRSRGSSKVFQRRFRGPLTVSGDIWGSQKRYRWFQTVGQFASLWLWSSTYVLCSRPFPERMYRILLKETFH